LPADERAALREADVVLEVRIVSTSREPLTGARQVPTFRSPPCAHLDGG